MLLRPWGRAEGRANQLNRNSGVNEFDVQAGGNGELSQIRVVGRHDLVAVIGEQNDCRVDRTCPSPATNAFVADTPRGWCVDLVS